MASSLLILNQISQELFDNTDLALKFRQTMRRKKRIIVTCQYILSHTTYDLRKRADESSWLTKYAEVQFFHFYRMKKETFLKLFDIIIRNDDQNLIKKKYRGGNFPTNPEKSLLIFIWYMAHQSTLEAIGLMFKIHASTVMHIVNNFLYVLLKIKNKFIFWPESQEEIAHVRNGFRHYPGALGAVDGSHIRLKVPVEQDDSYTDRFMQRSINLMGITTADKIFSYIFVGFPGSAHDSRVFSSSTFVRNIERYGSGYYFRNPDHHLIGDSAFPIRVWMMTPYKNPRNRLQKYHNFCLSQDRVVVENVFGLVKGRWRRLIYINTYSVSKGIEIATAACVLHNFCYLHDDFCGENYMEERERQDYRENNAQEAILGQQKRDLIAQNLIDN